MSNKGGHFNQQSYLNWQAPAQAMDSPRHIGSPVEMSGNEMERRHHSGVPSSLSR